MKAHDREVAGIRCTEVLEDLSDYLDGELPAERVEQIEVHLAGCSRCERFGGDFRDTIGALRGLLGDAPSPPEDIRRRLMDRLDHTADD